MIKYNHYSETFKHVDGAIAWEDIDEEYAFSDVFEGDYNLQLMKEKDAAANKGPYLVSKLEVFYGLEDGETYVIKV